MDVEALAQMRGHNLTEQIPRSRDLWYQVPGADQCKPRLHTVTVPCKRHLDLVSVVCKSVFIEFR